MNDLGYYVTQIAELWQQKLALGTIIGTLAAVCGVSESMLTTVTILMFIDLLFGLFVAAYKHTFSIEKMRRGVMKFIAYYVSILLVGVMNVHTSEAIGWQIPLQNIYVAYLISTEALSIMLHCNQLGMPFPPLVRYILHGYRSKTEGIIKKMLKPQGNNAEATN